MQHDEVIWQVLRHKHCSYMAKIETGILCRNSYNLTGICNRSSCPLSNSRYATIRDQDGVFYLYMKTIERAHMPKNLWERVKLPSNYDKAFETIDKHLLFWPKLLQHKVKQRLTKMTQIRTRMKHLALKPREKVMTTPTGKNKIDARREEKALKAAALDKVIEDELLMRLKNGIYPEIYNFPEELKEEEPEIEYVEDYEDLEEEEDMEDLFGKRSGLDDDEHDSADEEEDDDGFEKQVVIHKRERRYSRKPEDHGKPKKKKRVVVEVEREEDEDVRQTLEKH